MLSKNSPFAIDLSQHDVSVGKSGKKLYKKNNKFFYCCKN